MAIFRRANERRALTRSGVRAHLGYAAYARTRESWTEWSDVIVCTIIHTQLYYYTVIGLCATRGGKKKNVICTTQLLARRYRVNNRLIDPRRSNCFTKLIRCIKVMDACWRSPGILRTPDYRDSINACMSNGIAVVCENSAMVRARSSNYARILFQLKITPSRKE